MPNLMTVDGSTGKKYLGADGAGTDGDPYVSVVSIGSKALTTVTGTFPAAGDSTLVAAPGAGNRIVVTSCFIQNESAVSTTVVLKSGATAKRRALLHTQGAAMTLAFNAGREWRLGTNEALAMNLSGANSHGYTVDFFVEAV